MSDPVKQAPFEDVLSSIRRLVREETGDPAQRRSRGELSAQRGADPYSEEAKQGLLDSLDMLMGPGARANDADHMPDQKSDHSPDHGLDHGPARADAGGMFMDPAVDGEADEAADRSGAGNGARNGAGTADEGRADAPTDAEAHAADAVAYELPAYELPASDLTATESPVSQSPSSETSAESAPQTLRPEALVLTSAFRIEPELEVEPELELEPELEPEQEADGEAVGEPTAETVAHADQGVTDPDTDSKPEANPDEHQRPPRSAIFIPQFLANRRGKVHDRDDIDATAPSALDDDAEIGGDRTTAWADEQSTTPAEAPADTESDGSTEPPVSSDLPWFRPSRRKPAVEAGTEFEVEAEPTFRHATRTTDSEPPADTATTAPVETFYEDEHAQGDDAVARYATFEDMRDAEDTPTGDAAETGEGGASAPSHDATQDALAGIVEAMAADAAREALAKVAEDMAADQPEAAATSTAQPDDASDHAKAAPTDQPEPQPAPKPKPVKDTAENVDKIFAAARAAHPEAGPEPLPEDAALFDEGGSHSLNDVPDFHPDEPEVEPLHASKLRRVAWKRDQPLAEVVPPEMDAEELDEVDPSERFGASDEPVMDEEALRELVSQLVKAELQGKLGERITRNVRKLVRREIHQMLASRDFD